MKTLSPANVLALGFMTFALFLGAGNVIFPPSAGLQAGEHLWPTAIGFLITAVGLPLLTLVALARVGGGIQELTAPLGQVPGLILAVLVYLAIGPLFATPRTATVSYEIGIVSFAGESWQTLLIYSLVYFAIVLGLALKPGSLVDSVGKIITPILLLALAVLGITALFFPAGEVGPVMQAYRDAPVIGGVLQGYLTMDALGALVFGVVITRAIQDYQVLDARGLTRYTIIASIIAAIALALVYLALFQLGGTSASLVAADANGGQILAAFVQYRFGSAGSVLLAIVIVLACLTTAVGLVSACGVFFSSIFPVRYSRIVWLICIFCTLISNQGLDSLIQVSVPVLAALYPLAIVLVCLGLFSSSLARPQNIMRPVMLVALIFGIVDGLKIAGFVDRDAAWLNYLPLSSLSLDWLVPALVILSLALVVERIRFGRLGKT